MWSVAFHILLVSLVNIGQHVWAQSCSQLSGPAGATACLKFSNYDQYQWATCLPESYLIERQHHCISPTADYCWSQCMLDVYNRESGPVNMACSCVPEQKLVSTLPSVCTSPAGSYCNWYRDCLERKLRCDDTSNAYAIRYAENFCKLYERRRELFSPEGQKWVDAARRCLLVNLVPILRPWIGLTCYQMRLGVFTTHRPCYLDPDLSVTTICDLNCKDYLRVFWTIRESFPKLDTAWESIKGLWNIDSSCPANSQIHQCFQGEAGRMMNFITIAVKKFNQVDRLSVSLPEADAGSRFADRIGSSIARILKWNTFVMSWVAYIQGSFGSSDDVDVIIVLTDSKTLRIVTASTPSVNFNHTLADFASAVEEGKLPLQVDGYNVWVKSLALCSDKSCARTKTLAVSENPPKWPVRSDVTNHIGYGPVQNEGARVPCGEVKLFEVLAVLFMYRSFF